jgi:NAD-dependent deacetylase
MAALDEVKRWVDDASRIVVLTGAGISTESGIPDFRGPQGVWTKNPLAEKLSNIHTTWPTRRAEGLVEVAARASRLERQAQRGPSRARRLEKRGKLHALITQNIDELHQMAGNSPDKVIEVHGTVRKVICMSCGMTAPMQRALDRVRAGEDDPPCRDCGGILKSATISFGQALVPEVIERAMRCAGEADLFIAIGTTLRVYPIAGAVDLAREAGARIVIVNAEETPYDGVADALIRQPIGAVLPQLLGRDARFAFARPQRLAGRGALWLAGNGLRITILAVPPVIPLIRDEFALNATQVAILSSIPLALLGLPPSWDRCSWRRSGSSARSSAGCCSWQAAPRCAASRATTRCSSSPRSSCARASRSCSRSCRAPFDSGCRADRARHRDLHERPLAGEVLAVLFTIPLVLPAVDGSWRASFVVWAIPVALVAVVVWIYAPRPAAPTVGPDVVPHKWLPDWHRGLVWRLGALFLCINAIYFGANTFIPIYFKSADRADLITGALVGLNFGQIPRRC